MDSYSTENSGARPCLVVVVVLLLVLLVLVLLLLLLLVLLLGVLLELELVVVAVVVMMTYGKEGAIRSVLVGRTQEMCPEIAGMVFSAVSLARQWEQWPQVGSHLQRIHDTSSTGDFRRSSISRV